MWGKINVAQNECDLLVVVENGFVHFSDKLQKHKFESVFRNVYLMDLSFGCKVFNLKIQNKNKSKRDLLIAIFIISNIF